MHAQNFLCHLHPTYASTSASFAALTVTGVRKKEGSGEKEEGKNERREKRERERGRERKRDFDDRSILELREKERKGDEIKKKKNIRSPPFAYNDE